MSVTFRSNMPALLAALDAACNELVLDSAKAVADGVIDAMGGGKSGIHYPSLPNVSSAPGEAPATQSGDYAGGVNAVYDGNLKAVAFTSAVQAPRLEFGDGRVAARPNWIVEAVKEAENANERGREKLQRAAESVSE